ncbi:MAG: GNAT family N-acetyltransferase [Bacilli bacterium]|jgi:predicted acetyltransferase|nr:GNAT family N-acetyltransferase [Bacilli bacterium]MDD4482398.1 GNAT family N-acetyltransferase [Bacilli bacterium]MDY0363908.1 GNAT family N-acetyltransferase [Bacilli bacterium]
MNLKLVKLSHKYKKQLYEMMDEWTKLEKKIIPWAINKVDYHNWDNYLNSLEIKEFTNNYVPDSTYFCLDEDRNIFIGAVNIRHYLNEKLLKNGGHIGDGIRPSERNKGLGTKMIKLALEKCKELKIKKVLMVCNKNNVASAKTIIKNGGILENEIIENDIIEQRYWIEI